MFFTCRSFVNFFLFPPVADRIHKSIHVMSVDNVIPLFEMKGCGLGSDKWLSLVLSVLKLYGFMAFLNLLFLFIFLTTLGYSCFTTLCIISAIQQIRGSVIWLYPSLLDFPPPPRTSTEHQLGFPYAMQQAFTSYLSMHGNVYMSTSISQFYSYLLSPLVSVC